MTIDINEARKLAELLDTVDEVRNERERAAAKHASDAASTIRALCDRVEAAERIMRDAEWKSIGMDTNECPSCSGSQDRGHAEDCKLAAWLGKEKAPTPPTMPR